VARLSSENFLQVFPVPFVSKMRPPPLETSADFRPPETSTAFYNPKPLKPISWSSRCTRGTPLDRSPQCHCLTHMKLEIAPRDVQLTTVYRKRLNETRSIILYPSVDLSCRKPIPPLRSPTGNNPPVLSLTINVPLSRLLVKHPTIHL